MSRIPEHVIKIREIFREVVSGLEGTFPFAQAFFSEQEGLNLQLAARETRAGSVPSQRGAVISVFNGAYFAEESTTDLTAEGLQAAADRLTRTVPVVAGQVEMPAGDSWEADYFSPVQINPFDLPMKEKLAHLERLREKTAGLDKRVVAAMVRYGEKRVRKVYVNRCKNLFQELMQTVCIPVVIVSDGKASKTMRAGNGRQAGFEMAQVSDDELERMVQEAVQLLHAGPVKPGNYDIVGGPGLSGVIAHEAFGHGVETDMFLKKRAMAVAFMDREVASPLVDLYDSPDYPGESGSYYFDDEGMKASETRIIEKGVLRRGLTDQRSAALLGIPRTANGRRESYRNKTYARMSTTYFGAGTSNVDEMIASIDSGLYMPRGSNGMEDPKGWGIQVESPYAIEIKGGKLTDRIFAPIVITGFVPDLLKSISMVGDTVGFEGMGICQKGHKEQVPVAIGGPHLKMRALVG